MSEIKLSSKQQDIVSFDKGAILVKASAGSGKTRVLIERIKVLKDKTKRKILAITFTNKAADEMKERFGNFNNVEKQLFIGTFHAFCQKVLENHGHAIGFANIPHIFENESDRLELIGQAIEKTPSFYSYYIKKSSKQQRDFRYSALSFISEVKQKLLSENELLQECDDENLILLYRTYQDILYSQNAIDFDDLILLTYNLFMENPAIVALYRRAYEYICIDEAQDLNYAQYRLLCSITMDKHQNVMMVGDPNQSIFAFNGSSPEYMTKKFVEDFKPKSIELNENYRSSKEVLKAARKIIPNSCNIVNTKINGIFEIHSMNDEESEAIWISNKIKELIKLGTHKDIEGSITYEKIAVLGRNKYIFKHLSNLFDKKNIPYFYKPPIGAIKFESELMKVFDMAFRIKVNSKDALYRHRLLKLFPNIKVNKLKEFENSLDLDIQYKIAIKTVLDFKKDGSNFRLLLDDFSKKIKEADYIKDFDNKKMILDDIKELLKHWNEYDKRTNRISLRQFKSSMALGKTHTPIQKKGIAFSTIHTMKGQEYDIIFLMGMDEGTFPDYRSIKNGGIEMVQEKNNVYVAFTRAKRFLYVTWPAKKSMPWGDADREISQFLKVFDI